MSLCFELGRGTVVVREDQLSLAIGRRGQNVRLAARLTGWDLDILTPDEFAKGLEALDEVVQGTEGIEGTATDRLAAFGMISVFDVEEVGWKWSPRSWKLIQRWPKHSSTHVRHEARSSPKSRPEPKKKKPVDKRKVRPKASRC